MTFTCLLCNYVVEGDEPGHDAHPFIFFNYERDAGKVCTDCYVRWVTPVKDQPQRWAIFAERLARESTCKHPVSTR